MNKAEAIQQELDAIEEIKTSNRSLLSKLADTTVHMARITAIRAATEAKTFEQMGKPDQCLVHRYLYYVMAEPILTDREYDILERDALEELWKQGQPPHPLDNPGSDRTDSYSPHIIQAAAELHHKHTQ